MSLALETYRQDDPHVGSALSRREGVLLSLVVHAMVVALVVLAPGWIQRTGAQTLQAPDESVRFVLMSPRIETPAVAKPNVDHSDRDRRAAAPTAAAVPANELPASIGNTIERTVGAPPEKPAGGEPPVPTPTASAPPVTDTATRYAAAEPPAATTKPPGSGLGQSIRNLQQYLSQQNYNNPQGAPVEPSADIQFDSKGVEFGPWIRRFLLQLKRNWFAPMTSSRGCTTFQFYVHRDGRITDIKNVRLSTFEPFNTSANAALNRTSPTLPLPVEYPDDRILFTVTFIYNERIGCT
jgi:hypothetical protein